MVLFLLVVKDSSGTNVTSGMTFPDWFMASKSLNEKTRIQFDGLEMREYILGLYGELSCAVTEMKHDVDIIVSIMGNAMVAGTVIGAIDRHSGPYVLSFKEVKGDNTSDSLAI